MSARPATGAGPPDDRHRRVGEIVRDARQQRGLSQLAASKMADVSTKTLSQLEKGKRLPTTVGVQGRIEGVLGLPQGFIRCSLDGSDPDEMISGSFDRLAEAEVAELAAARRELRQARLELSAVTELLDRVARAIEAREPGPPGGSADR